MKIRKCLKKIIGNKNKEKILNLMYMFQYYFYKILNLWKNSKRWKILNFSDTINKIIVEKKSISRYGDGEFKWLLNIEQPGSFEKNSVLLCERLKKVLLEKNQKLMICIPYCLKDNTNYTWPAKAFWEKFLFKFYNRIKEYIKEDCIYGNASISRCYMDYKDKSNCGKNFKLLKRIWENRDVIIVEGENTKFGMNNDFLNNVNSIKRIICPNKNAFQKYNLILKECKKCGEDILFLIALGPTATILASDLSKEGYQAIDIGHADIEYEWFLKGALEKQEVLGKEVNESIKKNDDFKVLENLEYKKSIIKRIE